MWWWEEFSDTLLDWDAKSIGTPNIVVPLAAMIQIWVTILSGVPIASLVVVGVASVFPSNIPIVFELRSGVGSDGSGIDFSDRLSWQIGVYPLLVACGAPDCPGVGFMRRY